MVHQVVSLQPTGTMQKRSPCADMEEPRVQRWTRPKGGTSHGYPCRNTHGQSCRLCGAAFGGAGRLGELLPVGNLYRAVPEEWVLWYGVMLEPCLESYSLWEAHVRSAWEGQHPMGGTAGGAGAESDHEVLVEMKCYGLQPHFLFPVPTEEKEGGRRGWLGRRCFLLL